MLCVNNRIFVCSAGTSFGSVTNKTRFYFKKYGEIIRAKFNGENILYGEIIGMVNQEGLLEAIFNFCTAESQFLSGTCSFKPKKMDNQRYELHGRWGLSGDESKEITLVDEKSF